MNLFSIVGRIVFGSSIHVINFFKNHSTHDRHVLVGNPTLYNKNEVVATGVRASLFALFSDELTLRKGMVTIYPFGSGFVGLYILIRFYFSACSDHVHVRFCFCLKCTTTSNFLIFLWYTRTLCSVHVILLQYC